MANSKRNWAAELTRITAGCVLAGGLGLGSAIAQAGGQQVVSDAQVEANVLKALAGSTQLANESIVTRTVYGTVTLTGAVKDESSRRLAESLAATAAGVQKVLDELTIGTGGVQSPDVSNGAPVNAEAVTAQSGAAPLVLQSDGSYAPMTSSDPAPGSAPAASAQRNDPDNDQALDQQGPSSINPETANNSQYPQQQQQGFPNPTAGDPGLPGYPARPQGGQQQPQSSVPYGNQQAPGQYGQGSYGQYPQTANNGNGGYGGYGAPQQQAGNYPPQSGNYPPQRRYRPYTQYGNPYEGQVAGQPVTIPVGALVRVRLNRTLSSQQSQAGTPFDATVINDVVAGGIVAIPRGASVQGVVVSTKPSGNLKGRGELSIQLTQVTLGGKFYPIQSDVWARHGGDKTIETVDKTAGFGAAGAVIGAIGGGGIGAAVGGGVGAAIGLGSSAASGRGEVFLPAEAVVNFLLVQPASVQSVSGQEMQRLAYGVPQGGEQPYLRQRRPINVYPGYYPYAYPGPYGYPPY